MRHTPSSGKSDSSAACNRLLILLASMMTLAAVLLLAANRLGAFEHSITLVRQETAEVTPDPTEEPDPTPVPTPEGLPDLDTSAWYLRLVSVANPIGETYEPESLADIGNDCVMDSRVSDILLELVSAAKADGYTVYICSGYRSYSTQYSIYWRHVNSYMAEGMTQEEAEAATQLAVNVPGCSEHQYGLSVDILESWDQDMEPYIGGSGLMLWLEENCAAYGFVVRYPDGKTDITGIEYEPWHLRYVGVEAATYMMENNLCLEEFLALYE